MGIQHRMQPRDVVGLDRRHDMVLRLNGDDDDDDDDGSDADDYTELCHNTCRRMIVEMKPHEYADHQPDMTITIAQPQLPPLSPQPPGAPLQPLPLRHTTSTSATSTTTTTTITTAATPPD